MRKLAILTFQTLDGVMQAPSLPEEDRSGGFVGGGWARPYWDAVMSQVRQAAMAEPYDLLLGRTTYEIFARAFADTDAEKAAANPMHEARKYVVTSDTDYAPRWQNTTVISGDIVQKITTLKQGPGALLQVHGSWQLVQLLHASRLIDEYRLWTFPVVLGRGKRLFGDDALPATFNLSRHAQTDTGVLMTFYTGN